MKFTEPVHGNLKLCYNKRRGDTLEKYNHGEELEG